jgi:hypothetical protein
MAMTSAQTPAEYKLDVEPLVCSFLAVICILVAFNI